MTATNQPPMPPSSVKKKRRWPWVVGVLVVLGAIGAAMGGGDKDTVDTASPAPMETPSTETDMPAADVEQVADETPAAQSTDSGISKGLGSKDASADVTEVQIIRDNDEFMPIDEVSVKVTNNSEKRSDYFIDVSIESADGSVKIDSTTIMVMNLEPGQSTVETGMLTKELPDDAVASVKSIQRTASN